MKLGEILIGKGVLTPGQLEKALKAQLILGGHLGTNLIELGFVDEDTLGKVLSESCGIPYAPPKLFASIPDATIKAVPEKVAEEYQVVPLMLTEQAVHLALVNPRDLHVLDELSFAIGKKIIPWIAPEVRVVQALEKYYGVGRRGRYITLGHQLDEAGARRRTGTGAAPKSPAVAEPSLEGGSSQVDFLTQELRDAEAGYGRPWQDVAEELEKRKSAAPPVEPSKPPKGSMPLSELAERYCRAESRDDLALAALDFGVGRAERMLLMMVRANQATVWHERGLALSDGAQAEVSFHVTSEALFSLLMGDDHFHGELPPRDDVRSFYRRLGVDAPSELLLVPIRVNDLLVAFFVADGGPQGRVHGDLEEFLKAFRLFGMSLGLLALRKKIRDAAQPVTRLGA